MAPRRKSAARAVATACCALAALADATVCAAPSDAERDRARKLGKDGQEKLKAEDYRGALESCSGAHAIMRVPSTGMCVARAQIGLGLLIEAAGVLREVIGYPETGNAVFNDAQREAKRLEQQLTPKIPELRFRLAPEPAGVKVLVDGAVVPSAALHTPRQVNPGRHRVTAGAPGYLGVTKTVTAAEGERSDVELPLLPSKPEAPAQTGVPLWAWLVGGTGVALTGATIGFAVDYAAARSTFARDCAETNSAGQAVCDPSRYSLEDSQALFARRNRSGGVAIGFGAASVVALTASIIGIAITNRGKREGAITISPSADGILAAVTF